MNDTPVRNDWYYINKNEEIVGPLSRKEMRAHFKEGKLQPFMEVRRGKSRRWQRAADVDGLFRSSKSPKEGKQCALADPLEPSGRRTLTSVREKHRVHDEFQGVNWAYECMVWIGFAVTSLATVVASALFGILNGVLLGLLSAVCNIGVSHLLFSAIGRFQGFQSSDIAAFTWYVPGRMCSRIFGVVCVCFAVALGVEYYQGPYHEYAQASSRYRDEWTALLAQHAPTEMEGNEWRRLRYDWLQLDGRVLVAESWNGAAWEVSSANAYLSKDRQPASSSTIRHIIYISASLEDVGHYVRSSGGSAFPAGQWVFSVYLYNSEDGTTVYAGGLQGSPPPDTTGTSGGELHSLSSSDLPEMYGWTREHDEIVVTTLIRDWF